MRSADAVEATYRTRTGISAELARRARAVMPGGQTRATTTYSPYPITAARAEGSRLWDVDGNEYLDVIGNFTSLVHGHRHPVVMAAAAQAMANGTAWTALCREQIELAEELVDRIGSVERVSFVNSGTEALMLATQLARMHTGRGRVLVSAYAYHGLHEHLKAGTYAGRVDRLPFGPLGHDLVPTLVARYGDTEAFAAVLREHGRDIAAVVLEPVTGSQGLVRPDDDFFREVARLARTAGALVIFDEVITLRLALGGAQEQIGVAPDLTTFGKIIGGGFPVGAVGGRLDVMKLLDPAGRVVSWSGTFSGNPVTAAAGLAAVRHLTQDRIEVMAKLTARLDDGLHTAAQRAGVVLSTRRAGSLLNVFFRSEPPPDLIDRSDAEAMRLFHLAALNHGLLISPRGLLATSTVTTPDDVARTVTMAEAAMADMKDNAAVTSHAESR